MDGSRQIFSTNETYTWLREQLLCRLPDGSLFCAFFTGGGGDGDLDNIVAAIRSDDDGETWSDVEVIVSRPDESCWAPSMFVHKGKAHMFYYTSKDPHRYRKVNHILSTGPDGRTFTEDRIISEDWITERGVDIRHGTHLRDGRCLLPIAWLEPIGDFDPDTWVPREDTFTRYNNFGWGGIAENNIFCDGVVEPNDDFTSFTRYGRIRHETPGAELPCQSLFEGAIAQLSGDNLAMLMRGDMSNRLWRSDSPDGGRTWSDPRKTDIPNPGSKPLIINLPDGRIALFHNPNEKDYDDTTQEGIHRFRTPLEMWVSDDDMMSWGMKKTLSPAPGVAQYPNGFYDEKADTIYMSWEDDVTISFLKIVSPDGGQLLVDGSVRTINELFDRQT